MSVMTISCQRCGHEWSIDLHTLPQHLRKELADALRDDF
jgi:hypothetical protein